MRLQFSCSPFKVLRASSVRNVYLSSVTFAEYWNSEIFDSVMHVTQRCGCVLVGPLGPSAYTHLEFLSCVFVIIWIKIKRVIQDNLGHGASKEPVYPL